MNLNPMQRLLLTVLISLIFSSCATIFSKSNYPLAINTNPPGAILEIKNKRNSTVYKGTSPAIVHLPAGQGYFSKSKYYIHISKPGYQEAIIPVFYSLDGWYLANLFIGGALGMLIIDPITGAMWKLETTFVNHNLAPTAEIITPDQHSLKVIDLAEVPMDLRKEMIPLIGMGDE
ncbi:MAG: hypothetical protein EA409_09420 [Saprospirales bacterium]|nr:MAG: hypothetical protein EA409_09420 [Saprospirales bacterium]